ncbi:MAG: ABC transporter ATP-binding protein [Campylobacteraceae bacterium]
MKGLKINHLTTGYRKKLIIEDLNLNTIPRGEVTTLLGPNGCGKSTLMRALAGLNDSSGDIVLDEINLSKIAFSQRSKKVVYLPQSLPSGIHLMVLESIMVAQRVTSNKSFSQDEIMQLLKKLGIEHLAFSFLDELSGGQKQLAGLAQSLIRAPDILLLDEPLSALDINHQFHVMDLVKKETIERNLITVIVVHDINIALRHSDYIVMMKDGKLVAQGKPFDVITPQNLSEVYGIKGRIECCTKGYPFVIVDGVN